MKRKTASKEVVFFIFKNKRTDSLEAGSVDKTSHFFS